MSDPIVEKLAENCEGDRSLHIFLLEEVCVYLLRTMRQRAALDEGGSERATLREIEKKLEYEDET